MAFRLDRPRYSKKYGALDEIDRWERLGGAGVSFDFSELRMFVYHDGLN